MFRFNWQSSPFSHLVVAQIWCHIFSHSCRLTSTAFMLASIFKLNSDNQHNPFIARATHQFSLFQNNTNLIMGRHSLSNNSIAQPVSPHFLLLQKRIAELEWEVFYLKHKDIKASNILLTPLKQDTQGSALLASFFEPKAVLEDSKVPLDIIALIYQLANDCYHPESLFTPQDVLLEAVLTAQGASSSEETLNVITESRRPSTYVAQIHATLRARKECREMVKVARFWKSQALQKEDSLDLVTPSSSALSDILLRDHEACQREASKALCTMSPILDADESLGSGNTFSHDQKAYDDTRGKVRSFALLEDEDSLFSGSMSSSPTSVSSMLLKLNRRFSESVAERERASVEISSPSVSFTSPGDVTLVCETIITSKSTDESFHTLDEIGKPGSTQHLSEEGNTFLCHDSPFHNEGTSRNNSEPDALPTVVFNTEKLHIRKKIEMSSSAAPFFRLPKSLLPKTSLSSYPRTLQIRPTPTPVKQQTPKSSTSSKRPSRLPTPSSSTLARTAYAPALTLTPSTKSSLEKASVANALKNQTHSAKSRNPSTKSSLRSAMVKPEKQPDATKPGKIVHPISTMGRGGGVAVKCNSSCVPDKVRGMIVATRTAAFEKAQRKN